MLYMHGLMESSLHHQEVKILHVSNREVGSLGLSGPSKAADCVGEIQILTASLHGYTFPPRPQKHRLGCMQDECVATFLGQPGSLLHAFNLVCLRR